MIDPRRTNEFKYYKTKLAKRFKGSVFRKCDALYSFEDFVICEHKTPWTAYLDVLNKFNLSHNT